LTFLIDLSIFVQVSLEETRLYLPCPSIYPIPTQLKFIYKSPKLNRKSYLKTWTSRAKVHSKSCNFFMFTPILCDVFARKRKRLGLRGKNRGVLGIRRNT